MSLICSKIFGDALMWYSVDWDVASKEFLPLAKQCFYCFTQGSNRIIYSWFNAERQTKLPSSLRISAYNTVRKKKKKKNTWWCPINHVFHVCVCNKYRKWLPDTHWTEKIILFTCAMHSRSACEHLTCQKKLWMDQINGRVVPTIIIGFSQLVFHHSET